MAGKRFSFGLHDPDTSYHGLLACSLYHPVMAAGFLLTVRFHLQPAVTNHTERAGCLSPPDTSQATRFCRFDFPGTKEHSFIHYTVAESSTKRGHALSFPFACVPQPSLYMFLQEFQVGANSASFKKVVSLSPF